MIYFFHHYELPVIIQQAQVQQILRLRTRQRHQQQNTNAAATANNASNLRNGSNTTGNQAHNNSATGGSGGVGVGSSHGIGVGVGNQMNNNGVGVGGGGGGGNNNNNPLNNHQRTLFAIISLIMNVQVVSILLNPILNAFGAVQGRLINYAFGTAAFSNNNNDNRLNNNNITNNNRNNNPSMNFTRLRLNLSRLRRINLAGIQINPIEINRVGEAETPPPPPNVNAENVNNDDNGGNGIRNVNSSVVAAAATATEANASLLAEIEVPVPSMGASMQNDHRDHEISTIDHSRSPAVAAAAAASSADFDLDFDIIDANDEIAIKPNELQLNIGRTTAENDTQDCVPKDRHSDAPIVTSLGCDMQIQSISSLSNNLPTTNATNDSVDRSNHLMTFDEPSPTNAIDNDSCYQIRSSKSCPNESKQQQQQQQGDNSLSNTKDDISAVTFEQANCSLSSALAQKSDIDLCEMAQTSTASAVNLTRPTVDSTATIEANRILVDKNVDLSDNETKIDPN